MLAFPKELPTLTDSAQVIIIGSGIAGLYTALELSQQYKVIIITKGTVNDSNTFYAQGGIAAALGENDSPELHYQDTIMAGAGLCDSEAVKVLVHEGPRRVRHLIELQVPFDRKEGSFSLTREAAHSRRRILHAGGDATGRGISETLIARVKEAGIPIYDEHYALALVKKDGQCCGVVTVANGNTQLFLGTAVVLCTGGIGQIFSKTTNPVIATGDGPSLAYNCGASLRDLEFVQFHPTALYLPPAPPFLISESVRGEGAILLNRFGERFMPNYHQLGELAPRDIVARSIFMEIEKTESQCVYLDLTKIKTIDVTQRFPTIYQNCLKYGLDILKDPIPVAPAAHYFMGGVATDLHGRTSVPGLYAAGEVAATGVHGANRLASNSLLEGLVFGGRVADQLLAASLKIPNLSPDLSVAYPRLFTDYQQRESDLKTLHQITDHYLGIVRDEAGIRKGLSVLNEKDGSFTEHDYNPKYFELQNMLLLAKLMAQAALIRTESRGGHYRSDFPQPGKEWRKHIVFNNTSRMAILDE